MAHRKGRRSGLGGSAGLGAACSILALGSGQAQEVLTPPPITVRPTVAVQETYTDNADLSASNRSSDYVTRGLLGLDAEVNSGRTVAMLHGDFAYDYYARQRELSGWSIAANGTGSYVIVRDRLTVEAQGSVTNGFVSSFNTSVTDRSGTPNRVQLATYDIGPRLTMTVADFADLAAALRFAQVFYSAADSSTVEALPDNDNIVQLIGRLDTGKRFTGYEALTTAEVDGDDRGYRSANAIQSIFVTVAPAVRLIGRAGYEHVFQPGVTRIDAEVLSVGVELTPNDRSRITLEGGRRYGRTVWAAKANWQLASRVSVTGSYAETIQPDQVYVATNLGDFVERTAALPAPIVPGSFRIGPNLYNRVSLNKTGEVHVIYAGRIQSLDLSADWSDRDFLSSRGHDRSLIGNVSYTRKLRPRLNGSLSVNYARTFESPLFGASETYRGAATATFQVNASTQFDVSYGASYARQLSPGGLRIQEHAVSLGLRKRF